MISEHRFAAAYTSFWREVTPIADSYWRAGNLAVERFAKPLETDANRSIRAVVNELAFETFCREYLAKESRGQKPSAQVARESLPGVVQYINRFAGALSLQASEITDDEVSEALVLAQRLGDFFTTRIGNRPVILRPQFSGCGIVSACQGDVLVGSTLFEVKSGYRSFRIVDLRQLLVYCALNMSQKKYEIRKVALLNPRVGVYWLRDLETITQAIAGRPATELLNDMIEYVSSLNVYA